MIPVFTVEIKKPPTALKIADKVGLLKALLKTMAEQNNLSVTHIVEQYASFPQDEPTTMDGLRTISGQLRSSYRASAPVIDSDEGISGAIGSNVVYAAIQEFGGQTRPHDIVARNAKALAFNPGTGKFFGAPEFGAALRGSRGNFRKLKAQLFVDENGIIFRRKVHHPGSDIPARQPIQRGIEDRLADYSKAFTETIVKFSNS